MRFCLLLLWFCLPVRAAEITVSAAASLKEAFVEIAAAYRQQYPDAAVKLNTAASGILLRQLLNGAPVDVLATADEDTMNRAVAARAVRAADRTVFARNALVLAVPNGSRLPHSSLPSLLRHPQIRRIAIGRPESVPAGAYAKAALQKQGLFDTLQSQFVYTQNVRQALTYVARGEADAGFVYRSDALAAAGKVRIAARVPTVRPVLYPAAPTASSRQPDEAKRFTAYLKSEQAQNILKTYGFEQP